MTKKEEIPEISQRIRQLREDRGLSQKALGKLVDVTDAAVTNWETGVRFPRGSNLKKLARALNVSESYILGTEENYKIPVTAYESKTSLVGRISMILSTLNEHQLSTILNLIERFNTSNSTTVDTKKKLG